MKPYRLRSVISLLLVGWLSCAPALATIPQDPVTGAFEGHVTNLQTNAPIPGAVVQFINQTTEVPVARRADAQGFFYQGLLQPGVYLIRARATGFKPYEAQQALYATRNNRVIPIPIQMEPETVVATTPNAPPPVATATPAAAPIEREEVPPELTATDGRRAGAFSDTEVSKLPLGGVTLTRSFDELALLTPGVALAPQSIGNGTGPGVGAGVGTSGQFAVNGLRSRANNFLVDGSDNNDEDIGVRRQGFFSLVPQSIESIKEFQIITALAPAAFGRNLGATVNAISKSGGNGWHGSAQGFLNTSHLNARNFFDTEAGNQTFGLRARAGQAVLDCTGITGNNFSNDCRTRNRALTVTNDSGQQESFTLGQGGFVLGGPLKRGKTFAFFSYEGQRLNAQQEHHFAVPTVDQRGVFGRGATGYFLDELATFTTGRNVSAYGYPTSFEGDAIFSLLPFANDPNGIYGANTFTQTLPASAQGNIASAKFDHNFNWRGRQQSVTARYNFTADARTLPVTGGAIYSGLRPAVRTQNLSTFLNNELSDTVFNQVRFSFGRTRLRFDEARDPSLLPSRVASNDSRFLLNAPLLLNSTLPNCLNADCTNTSANTNAVRYLRSGEVESRLGRIGQINIAGFSPVGVDVFNFPQSRVNNTWQVADQLTWRANSRHNVALGFDLRRTELNSDLPRNARTLLNFNGNFTFLTPSGATAGSFYTLSAINMAAAGVPSGAFLSIADPQLGASAISLRYGQRNIFLQDDWRVLPNLSVNFGLRHEYNSPPAERDGLIERSFNDPLLRNAAVSGLGKYLEGRTKIFEPDENNFAPRVSMAYAPKLFGAQRATSIRAGYGLYYDQAIGAVVSQSRNVLPNFLTLNTGGFVETPLKDAQGQPLELLGRQIGAFFFFNPALGGITTAGRFTPLVQPDTRNTRNANLTNELILQVFADPNNKLFPNALTATLPARNFPTPLAHQYSVSVEQQLSRASFLKLSYVGTRGENLIRTSTPNLGVNNVVAPLLIRVYNANQGDLSLTPFFIGASLPPGLGRPTTGFGGITIYEATAVSRYHSFQMQFRSQWKRWQGQFNYTLSHALDDASDVFDLAGSSALPQSSLTRAGEYASSNFDARQRLSYSTSLRLPSLRTSASRWKRNVLGGYEVLGTGQYQTGQPFTVISLYDWNLDGNLTDRLNNTNGLLVTGHRRQPLRLADSVTNRNLLLAPVGFEGAIARNTFRGSSYLLLNLALQKSLAFNEKRQLQFRAEAFNFLNRTNFALPVRILEAPSFGSSVSTATPARRIQFALKYVF